MKGRISALIAGIILGTAATGVAATSNWSQRSNGVWCKQTGENVACIPTSAEGYGIAISRSAVLVRNINTNRNVFMRYQP